MYVCVCVCERVECPSVVVDVGVGQDKVQDGGRCQDAHWHVAWTHEKWHLVNLTIGLSIISSCDVGQYFHIDILYCFDKSPCILNAKTEAGGDLCPTIHVAVYFNP